MILKQIFITLLILALFSCTQNEINNDTTSDKEGRNEIIESVKGESKKKAIDSIPFRDVSEYLGQVQNEKKKVIVIPCYNGYEYSQQGYDFNPLLEKILMNSNEIEYVSFPFKKMQGSGYQSVYDKKYCTKIIKNTEVDYLIMTKFTGNLLDITTNTKSWGYETKILNVKTMKQLISIKANNLKNYEEIENEIELNQDKLIKDILKL